MERDHKRVHVIHVESKPVMNPLWVITIGMGVFFAFMAALMALG